MKNLIFIITIAIFMILSACNSETQVEIMLEPTKSDAPANDTVKYIYVLRPDALKRGKLGKLKVTDVTANKPLFDHTYSGDKIIKDSIIYIVPQDAIIGKSINILFEATDGKSGNMTKKTATINIIAPNPNIIDTNNIRSFFSPNTLSNTMIFDITNSGIRLFGGDYSQGELAFVCDTTSENFAILSPNAKWIKDMYKVQGIEYDTTNKQTTKFSKITESWDKLDKVTINKLNISKSDTVTAGGNGVEMLKIGDIISFNTTDGRKGVVKIIATSKNDYSITINLKYQQNNMK